MRFLNVHRAWEDWLSMALGVVIGLTPWIAREVGNQTVIHNALVVGSLVLALAAIEQLDLHRWEEAGKIACGLWLIASPFVFRYAESGALKDWHFTLGAAVMLLAMLEFWQDWKVSDAQLASRGIIQNDFERSR
jgi:hypothetical protein